MRYGNTPRELKRVLIVGLVIGGIAYVFSAAMGLLVEHLPVQRLLPLTFIIVLPPLILGLAILPTILFSIHVGDHWVEHRFLDRHLLSRARIQDFQRMRTGPPPFAAALDFKDGTRIRILGMHLGSLSKLKHDLSKRARALRKNSRTSPSLPAS